MQRRQFLALALSGALLPSLACMLRSVELPQDLKITRIIGFSLPSRRNRVVGKNSRLGVHGDRGGDRLLRVTTNQGLEGIGSLGAFINMFQKEDAARLIGTNPFAGYNAETRRFEGVGTATMAFWDLAGKATGRPVWKLLGGEGPRRVPVYDGSIYFQDLLPEHAGRWRDRFKEEIDMGLARGHRAFKIKIGRGAKWMARAAGDRRDVEVVKLIRAHGGKDLVIGVDANNGYDLAGTKRFLEQAGDVGIEWVEEMFPEVVEDCLTLKEFMKAHGWPTLLTDGETQKDLDVYKPFVEARAVDALQGDINLFGVDGVIAMAALGRPHGVKVMPHNWGSFNGFYQMAQIGRAIPNFYRAEQDPLENRVLIPEGYTVKDGFVTVPDAPGNGMRIDERYFASDVKILFDVKA